MRSPLRRLVLIATIVVALVAVLVTAVAALQLVRNVDDTEARAALSTQVDRLAAATPATRESLVAGLSDLSDPGALVAVIGSDGVVQGSARFVVPDRVVAAVRAGESVSSTAHRDGVAYLLEARPLDGGGGVVAAQDVSTVRSLSRGVLVRLLLALAIGFLVAVVVAVVAARMLSRPLARVAGAARELASGKRDVHLQPSRIDEVRDVEAALEALGGALARSEARQREFLLSISHELRTPLTAIRGYSEALRDGLITPERLPDAGATLEAEATRLAAFTDDLLALARLEADDFPVRPMPVDVAEILAAAARAWGGSAGAAGIELVAETVPLQIVTDPARVRQIVDGLIENALRVSPADTVIRVRDTAAADGSCIIEVADTGPGLSEEDAARAFERGVLRDRYRDVRSVGTGLGLSIAARLVQRLGGSITARPGAGSGTVFRIVLPPGAATT